MAAKATGTKKISASALPVPPSASVSSAISARLRTLQLRKKASRKRLRTIRSRGRSETKMAIKVAAPNNAASRGRLDLCQVNAT